jgi:siroheme synthase-like protein
MLPLAFKVAGQPVLVLGAGVIGTRKAQQLLHEGAVVDLISEEFLAPLPEGLRTVQQRRYQPGDLAGYRLVISAVNNRATNEQIVAEADERGIWLNVVDVPELCTFYFMALHTQGDVTVSVTTRGAAPALAQMVRDDVARALPTHLGWVAETLRTERAAVHERGESSEDVDWRPRIRALLDEPGPLST